MTLIESPSFEGNQAGKSPKKGKQAIRILFFGIYSKRAEYPRTNNLIKAFEACGAEVVECRYHMASSFKERFRSATTFFGALRYGTQILASFFSLSVQYLKIPSPIHVIFVAHPGYFHCQLARLLCAFKNRRAAILYDVFFSLYDSMVHDRRLLSPKGAPARFIHALEMSACRAADLNIIDTRTHGDYLAREFKIDPDKFLPIFVGAGFPPYEKPCIRPRRDGKFSVLFVGTYIPLHGVDVIIKAARLLRNDPEIHFRLVGFGQLKEEMVKLARQQNLKNMVFQNWAPVNRLGDLIRSHDLALGIFGTTNKAARVIPIKIFDICACGVPFISSDTPAVGEVFRHGENAWLVPGGDPKALARAIRDMKRDRKMRERIANGAYKAGQDMFSIEKMGKDLMKAVFGTEMKKFVQVQVVDPGL
ncbi:MAG: glycosyltransferase family 4 protein [Deltaproteobacteria bacterium]|nr:glycosyltransferase family 4 protein [Deltaproteobacteria bacterium]